MEKSRVLEMIRNGSKDSGNREIKDADLEILIQESLKGDEEALVILISLSMKLATDSVLNVKLGDIE